MPEWCGKVTGLTGQFLHGWVYDSDDLTQRTVIQLYCDGVPLDTAIAQVFERELQSAEVGDAHYGFCFKLPPGILKWGKNLWVGVANTGYLLEPAFNLRSVSAISGEGSTTPFSKVFHAGGLRLKGWVWNPTRPEQQLNVSIFADGVEVAELRANQYQANLDKQVREYAFEIVLPATLADGQMHELSIVDERGVELNGSPIALIEQVAGLRQLLARSAYDDNSYQLLDKLLKQYDGYWPRSVSMTDYPLWFEVFGKLTVCETIAVVNIGFLILGKPESVETERSRISLQRQGYKTWCLLDPGLNIEDSLAGIDYICVLKAGDEVIDNALGWVAATLDSEQPGLLYTDSDHRTIEGQLLQPLFRSAWNYEYFCAYDYIEGCAFIHCDIFKSVLSNINLHSLIHQSVAKCGHEQLSVSHLPKVVFRKPWSSVDTGGENCPFVIQKQKVTQAFLDQVEPGAIAETQAGFPLAFRVVRPLSEKPLVSVIVPTRDQHKLLVTCLESLLQKTTYKSFEIIIIDNQSIEEETKACFERFQKAGVRIISYDKPFNYSAMNNVAVTEARGSVVCLFNNDVEVISPGWLEEMLGLLLRPGIGAVGAKLLWSNGMVQHGGVVLGEHGLAGHLGNHLHDEDSGYMHRNQVSQQLSAVTAACLLVRKADYLTVGGFNEFDFPVAFNDVDFCLKLQERGLRNVWSAHAKLFHSESASRGKEDSPGKRARAYREQQALKSSWGGVLVDDPHVPSKLDWNLEGLDASIR